MPHAIFIDSKFQLETLETHQSDELIAKALSGKKSKYSMRLI